MVRTFSRADWDAASEAWHEGEYDRDLWYQVRRAAAGRGMLYPPTGERGDGCDDPHPSQRAIVYRAIDSTPELLLAVIGRSSSWSQVVVELIHASDASRTDAELAELEADRQDETSRRRDRATAPQRLGDVMRRAADR